MEITQGSLDKEMREATASRYVKRNKRKVDKGAASTTSWGQRLLNGAIEPVVKELTRMLASKGEPGYRSGGQQCLRQVDPSVATLLAIQQTLDSLVDRPTFNSLATKIGRLIDQERRYEMMAHDDEYRPLWKWLLENTKTQTSEKRRSRVITAAAKRLGAYSEPWPALDSFRAGALMLRLIAEQTGMIRFKRNSPRGRKTRSQKFPRFVEAEPETLEWIEQAKVRDALFLEPVKMPCVVVPYKWTSYKDGGYSLKGNWGGTLIKSTAGDSLDNNTPLQCPKVFDAVNLLQSVPYRINRPVLDVMEHCRDKGLQVGGLPNIYNDLLPTKPLDMDDLEVRKSWRRRSRLVYEQNIRSQSMRIHVAKLVYLARRMQDANLHFVTTLDFRGRMYNEASGFLQPQGADWARGLLEFGFSKPLDDDGARNLAITGANLFGVGGSYDERLEWISNNDAEIRRVSKSPMDCLEFWSKCDEPWQFLGFCMDWNQLQTRGSKHESHLICHRDASCNGLQIFSMLLKDRTGGSSVNLIDQESPSDAYADVSRRALELMGEEDDPELMKYAKAWIDYGVPRSASKRSLMITPYNGSLYSAQGYIEEWYRDSRQGTKCRKVHQEEPEALRYLGKKIWAAIDSQLSKAREAMTWFSQVADLCTDAGYQMRWRTPSGFLVVQDYKNLEPFTIRTILGRRAVMWHSLQRDAPGIHRRRARNSLSPNYVHSLDAAALTMTVNDLMKNHGIECFSGVHDSYGCLAADVEVMNKVIREQWQKMFERPLLAGFRDEVEKDTGLSLPQLPAYGELVLMLDKARYFFN